MVYKEKIKIDGEEIEVEITEPVPKRIPKEVEIYGVKIPVDKETFRRVWIAEHITPESLHRVAKKLFGEII